MNRKPLLLGHRGCRSAGITENSLVAFAHAISQGCDGFEFDVRYTRDGRNVIWHDPDRRGKDIASTAYAALADRNGDTLGSLDDVLARFGQSAYLDIELKVAGHEVVHRRSVARQSAATRAHGVVVLSRNTFPIAGPRRAAAAWIHLRPSLRARRCDLPVQVVLPRHNLLNQQLIDEAHRLGRQVMAWTVNSWTQMQQLADWGIDGLISDFPELLYQTFHSG